MLATTAAGSIRPLAGGVGRAGGLPNCGCGAAGAGVAAWDAPPWAWGRGRVPARLRKPIYALGGGYAAPPAFRSNRSDFVRQYVAGLFRRIEHDKLLSPAVHVERTGLIVVGHVLREHRLVLRQRPILLADYRRRLLTTLVSRKPRMQRLKIFLGLGEHVGHLELFGLALSQQSVGARLQKMQVAQRISRLRP